jgi:hypothetical protein
VSFSIGNTTSYLFPPFRLLQQPKSAADTHGYYKKPTPKSVILTARDGMTVTLKLWQTSPVVLCKCTPLLFLPDAAVDDRIFSLPTILGNTIDYFTSLGYKCYFLVPRFGAGQVARYGYTTLYARLDVRPNMEYVYEQENAQVYVIAHCLQSVATAMSLRTGEIDTNWIAGMTASQVLIHIAYSPDNASKARRPWLIKLYEVFWPFTIRS